MTIDYKQPCTASVTRNWEHNDTTLTIYMSGDVDEERLNDAFAFVKPLFGCEAYMPKEVSVPKPERVILNKPATIVLWSDGTKTIAKCDEDDSYDPLFGIIACVIRKLGRNRVKVNSWGWVIEFLADNMMDPDECRFISDVLAVTADAWELDGVNDAMEPFSESGQDGDGDE